MNKYHTYITSPEWRRKTAIFRHLMRDRCAVLPLLKSNDAHHMTYANLEHEIFLRDCVPLSKVVHLSIVHPVSRLFVYKHDIHFIRFFVNWLFLRPICLFWFLSFLAIGFLSKLIGQKITLTILELLVLVFGYLALLHPIYWVAVFVFVNFFVVFKK